MKKLTALFVLLLISSLLIGCQQADPKTPIPSPPKMSATDYLSSFFLKDGAIATFEGVGNEYASLTQKTFWHNKTTVSIIEANGGSSILRTYRLKDDGIYLIQEIGEYYNEYAPSEDELTALSEKELILPYPLPAETSVVTPLQTFSQAYVIEEASKDGAVVKHYYVKDFGMVKREFIMQNGETISSSLSKIE